MLFNSSTFFYFFLAVAVLYISTPRRHAWLVLLAGSYFFYLSWSRIGLLYVLAQTLATYGATNVIARCGTPQRRRMILGLGLVPTLGMLLALKYMSFANESVRAVSHVMGFVYGVPTLSLAAPIGISFFTFQNAGYLFDVYRGKVTAHRHLGHVALFSAFFPQILAGPIERGGRLLPQLAAPGPIQIDGVISGAKRVLWGLFKKIVVADRLAAYVGPVYGAPLHYSGPTLVLATYLFTFQIYCDFSGYSDMAIGLARILGIELMENFRFPYLATSVVDFWHRWHISLSTWFRDYLYIPLGGNRVSMPRWIVNVLLVFVVSGLWHGAAWTFFVWGGLHGIYVALERLTSSARAKFWQAARVSENVHRWISRFITFHLVVFAWIFFRADSIGDAFLIVYRIISGVHGRLFHGSSQVTTLLGLALVAILIAAELALAWATGADNQGAPRYKWPIGIRWTAYVAMILAIAILGISSNGFIYSKF